MIVFSVRSSEIKTFWLSILCIIDYCISAVLCYSQQPVLSLSTLPDPKCRSVCIFSVTTKKCWNVAAQVCDVDVEILSFSKSRYFILYFLIKISTLTFLSFTLSLVSSQHTFQYKEVCYLFFSSAGYWRPYFPLVCLPSPTS